MGLKDPLWGGTEGGHVVTCPLRFFCQIFIRGEMKKGSPKPTHEGKTQSFNTHAMSASCRLIEDKGLGGVVITNHHPPSLDQPDVLPTVGANVRVQTR